MRLVPLLAVCLVACNDPFIDPSDTGVLETAGDVAPETTPDRPSLVVSEVTRRAGGLDATVCLVGGAAGLGLDLASLVATFGDAAATVTPDESGRCVALSATRPAGKHSLRVTAADSGGAVPEPLWLPLWVEASPFDWRRALLYMVMVDRFRDADGRADPVPEVAPIANYQGGDFAGITAAIEEGYFDALGVDALWLTPITDNAEGGLLGIDGVHLYAGYHGYWPIDPLRLEARFGSHGETADADLRALVTAAHARGLRVVLDAALNHVHEQHPYCTELDLCRHTCVCGEPGCDWGARARDCQFASYLPDLDFRDETTRTRVVADLMALVRQYDFDGLRVDAVKHMDPALIEAIRAAVASLEAAGGAPFWLVGETFTGGDGRAQLTPSLGEDLLDGLFDFPLYWTLRDTFVSDGSFRALEAALVASEAAYGDHLALMSPFLGNHDVERMSTALAKNDLGPWGGTIDALAGTTGETPSRWDVINPMSMAMAFLLTLRGVPLVYYGDELGLGGSNDPDNRRMLPVALSPDQAELLRRTRELGRARRDHPVLALGERRELWIDDDVYVQGRWLGGGDVAIVAMNKGEARTLEVTLPAELGAAGRTFTSLLSDRRVSAAGDRLSLVLAPWEYVLLVAE